MLLFLRRRIKIPVMRNAKTDRSLTEVFFVLSVPCFGADRISYACTL